MKPKTKQNKKTDKKLNKTQQNKTGPSGLHKHNEAIRISIVKIL